CPYCAVGCGMLVGVKDGKIINIEGNPDSPINRGTLCPKGAASFQLAVNPLRSTKALYRRPGGTNWEEITLDKAMDRIAERVKKTRDETFHEFVPIKDADGKEVQKRANHTMAIFSLGGATMDNEWNYVHAKLMRVPGSGRHRKPGAYMTLRHGARFGHLNGAGRCHHVRHEHPAT